MCRGVRSGRWPCSRSPSAPASVRGSYTDAEHVSFVGRPFPLSEARTHCARLRAWGLPLIRLLVTWEALSHAGPCPAYDIDREYVAYLQELLTIMDEYGLRCIVCAHQDVWSRLCGGSGAPGWTLAAAGLDSTQLHPSAAALVPEAGGAPLTSTPPRGKHEPTGAFDWPSGYQKMAPATMATLFWGGRMYAPNLCLLRDHTGAEKHENIQDYLQGAYIAAYTRLVEALAACPALIGCDLMNEPHRGYVGLYSYDQWCYETDLHVGHFPSALQGWALADGHPQSVPFYVRSWPFPTKVSHQTRIDPGAGAWLPPNAAFASTRLDTGCVWREHGVWAWDAQKEKPVVLQNDYFHIDPRPGQHRRPVEFYTDFYKPFLHRFSEAYVVPLTQPVPLCPPPADPRGADAERVFSRLATHDAGRAKGGAAATHARVRAALLRSERALLQGIQRHERERPGPEPRHVPALGAVLWGWWTRPQLLHAAPAAVRARICGAWRRADPHWRSRDPVRREQHPAYAPRQLRRAAYPVGRAGLEP